MRKALALLAFVVVAMSSCDTLNKTARTADISSSIQNATVADLEVSDRISYTMNPVPKDIQRGGMENVKQAAEAEALEKKGGNADILLEPQYVLVKKKTFFGSKVESVTVSGRPARYKNFRTLNDSVWSNPYFRGMKMNARKSYFTASNKPGKVAAAVADYDDGIRKCGFTSILDLNVAYDRFNDWDSTDGLGLGGTLSLGYQFTPNIFLGVGTGVYGDFGDLDGQLIPIFAHGRYYTSKSKNSMFVDCKIGASANIDATLYGEDINSGFYFSPSLGYSFNHFEIALQYQHNALSVDDYEEEYKFKLNTWGLSLGWRF